MWKIHSGDASLDNRCSNWMGIKAARSPPMMERDGVRIRVLVLRNSGYELGDCCD